MSEPGGEDSSQGDAPKAAFWERAVEVLLPCTPQEQDVLVAGHGAWLVTSEGRELLDLGAGQVCATFGHTHPGITESLCEQVRRLVHSGGRFCSHQAVAAAEAVLSITPSGLGKVAFLSTGTEANEFAVRLAKLATGRTAMAAPVKGYLGTSLMLRGLSEPFVDEPSSYPRPAECYQFDWAIDGTPPEHAVEQILTALDPLVDRLAAVILEPILGAHGILPAPRGLLTAIRQYTEKHGVLMIIDEAQTGMGRTGRWFACDHEGVMPDILVFSKCAGNGFPVSCVVLTDAVAERVLSGGFFYLSSHQADPLALAAVTATIRAAHDCDAPARAARLGDYLATGLREVCRGTPLLTDVTGRGLFLGLHCAVVDENIPPTRISRRLFQRALSHDVIFGYGDWGGQLLLTPPLCITNAEIDRALQVLRIAVREVEAEIERGEDLPTWDCPNVLTRRFLEGLSVFRQAAKE